MDYDRKRSLLAGLRVKGIYRHREERKEEVLQCAVFMRLYFNVPLA